LQTFTRGFIISLRFPAWQFNSLGISMKKFTSLILAAYIYVVANASMVHAQTGGSDNLLESTQNDIMLIAGAGGGGAILGLSTLSFVSEPSKHVSNIWTGAALGVIVGVMFVAYNSAQKGTEDLQSSTEFNSYERVAWHDQNTKILTPSKVQFGTQLLQLSF
jgi:hypothetical protein